MFFYLFPEKIRSIQPKHYHITPASVLYFVSQWNLVCLLFILHPVTIVLCPQVNNFTMSIPQELNLRVLFLHQALKVPLWIYSTVWLFQIQLLMQVRTWTIQILRRVLSEPNWRVSNMVIFFKALLIFSRKGFCWLWESETFRAQTSTCFVSFWLRPSILGIEKQYKEDES